MFATRLRQNTILPLFLIAIAASFGVVMSLHIAPGIVGKIAYSLSHLWMWGLPLAWHIWVDRGTISLSRPKRVELLVGTILGLLMLGAILGAYWLFGQQWIDPLTVKSKAQQIGTNNVWIYLTGAIYFSFVNSLIEEYVWRWFVTGKCEKLLPKNGAIILAALLFTLHHIIGLAAYVDWRTVFLGSLGVFIGGAIWSWSYLTYRSIWSSYISHILADIAIAIVGWQLLFN
ncbi:MAG: CPBP family intramembrane metalloprotease [Hydrococcus sp. RM1_1_31]|nr:CPBP family intramembrane metalloprotease [Hydrococcus sp. RM1_1_31]